MRLVMAVSADGYVARGLDDDMRWAGRADKQAFRLLTSVGGVCAAGSTTFGLMPGLQGRRLVQLTRRAPQGFDQLDGARSMTLSQFAYAHPNGWLLGGQTVALEALDGMMLDEVFLVRNRTSLGSGVAEDMRWRMAKRFWDSRDVVTLDCEADGSSAVVERWSRRG